VLSLITPTGGRPAAFRLLERYIADQTYTGMVEWIVVDDGPAPMTITGPKLIRAPRVIRREPCWTPRGGPTLVANLAAGLREARGEKILFIEDDECYLPRYLENMEAALDRHQIAGQVPARYYNVRTRTYRVLSNETHASLCQTGIRRELVEPFLGMLQALPNPFLDIPLWRRFGPDGLSFGAADVVSIKGMPGRPGIGAGHRPSGVSWNRDPDCVELRSWVGTRYTEYLPFYVPR